MRLWSVHPRYLDTKGLTACWREGLLARHVLSGTTKGYRHHPQLIRFRNTSSPIAALDTYLHSIVSEAQARGYHFDSSKIDINAHAPTISVTRGQLEYELDHLKKKLLHRDPNAFERIQKISVIELNPLFNLIDGPVESWEIVSVHSEQTTHFNP